MKLLQTKKGILDDIIIIHAILSLEVNFKET